MCRFFWVSAVLLGAAVLGAVVFVRGAGISASRDPFPGEERIARAAWRFMVPRDMRTAASPVPNTPEVLRRGLEHWADHCAICHGNDGSATSSIGPRTYPPSPDMRLPRTQSLTDGELFYAIEQGIPWTAMPGW